MQSDSSWSNQPNAAHNAIVLYTACGIWHVILLRTSYSEIMLIVWEIFKRTLKKWNMR